MPPVVAAITLAVETAELATVDALVSVGISATTAAAIASALPGVLLTAGLVGAELLLDRPPKPVGQQTPIKTEIPPRVSGYGRARLSGAYMLFEAPSASWLGVLAVHDGQMDGWERFFYHDDEVDVDTSATGPGVVGGYVNPGPRYPKGDLYYQRGHGPNGTFQATMGQTPGPGFPDLVNYCDTYANGLWTSDHRGDGVAAFYGRAASVGVQYQNAVWPNSVPNLSASGRLLLTYDPRLNGTLNMGPLAAGASSYYPTPSPSWTWNENPACALIHFLCVHPAGPGLDFATKIAPNIDAWIDAANVCDALMPRHYAQAHITSQPWVDIGNSLCSLADGTAGVEEGFVGTIEAGQVIYFAGEHLTVSSLGAPVDGGLHGYIVNFTTDFALSHKTNELVMWQPPNNTIFEKTYRIGGAFSWDADPVDTIKQMLTIMDGWLGTKGDGSLVVYAGAYYEPTVTITDPYVIDYEVQHFTVDEEAVNEYKPTFVDPDRKFNETDAGAWLDENDISIRGVVRSQPLQMPWCPSATQARRIAKARMKRNSAELRGWIRTNMWGMNALGERFVNIQISENESLHSIVAEVTKITVDLPSLTMVFEWIQVDSTLYDWDIYTDELPPFVTSGGGGASTFLGLPAPTISSATVNAVPVTGGGTGSTLTITVPNPPGEYGVPGNTADFVVQTAPASSGDWTQQTINNVTIGATTTTFTTNIVQAGSIDVQVAYATPGGISAFSSTTTVNAAQPDAANPVTMTASENITAPALVNVWSSSGAKIRNADNSLGQQADGFILESVLLGNTVTVYFGGELTGLTGLTPGPAWCGTSGAVVTSAPGSTVMSQLVGEIIDAGDTLMFAPAPPIFAS